MGEGGEYMFNRRLFRGKVVSEGLTLTEVAKMLGINYSTLDRKMSGKSEFTRAEIQRLRTILNCSPEEVDHIFFAEELTETQETR